MSAAVAPVPCPKCPFRQDVPIYLTSDRREGIVEALREGGDFYCHQTTKHEEYEDGTEEMVATSDSSICAGAAKATMAAGGSSQMMRISERLGMVNLDKVEARGAAVWALDQWPRLAIGSTAAGPVWEVGDEHGVEACCVVGDGCEAPAGYMGSGGMVIRGTVEATNPCEACGEFCCDNCLSEDMDFCSNCNPPEDEEEEYE